MTADPIAIRRLDATEAEACIAELGDVLMDAVAHGASVNFLAGFSRREAASFWQSQLPGITDGSRRLLVAAAERSLVGTVVVTLASQPNAPHRAEVGKMLVRSDLRRRGLGRRLLAAAEAEALEAGRSLLLLDTESGSAGDQLYRSCGWVEYGRVPDHALTPDGRLAETTMFYKRIAPG